MDDPTELKGRAEKAIGEATDNEDLKHDGAVDEKAGTVKGKLDDAIDKVRGALHHDRDKQ